MRRYRLALTMDELRTIRQAVTERLDYLEMDLEEELSEGVDTALKLEWMKTLDLRNKIDIYCNYADSED